MHNRRPVLMFLLDDLYDLPDFVDDRVIQVNDIKIGDLNQLKDNREKLLLIVNSKFGGIVGEI